MSSGRITEPPEEERALRDQRLARILADCSDRLNAGESLDVREVAAGYPDLEPELGMALEALDDIAPAEYSDTVPSALGEYRILRPLARGGMGVIYEAWQASMDRRVALKVLPPGMLANRRAVARFHREAKAAGRLHHPNIVSVYGTGTDASTPYFAMEFVEGETLDQILGRLRPGSGDELAPGERASSVLSRLFPAGGSAMSETGDGFAWPEEREPSSSDSRSDGSLDTREINLRYCLRIAGAFGAVAGGLQHAHQNGVIHRDLKPSNLILDQEGRLRILDFGLARLEGQESLTESGDRLGTPLYMSPEQVGSRRVVVDHRTDIYSLGATLYEMLTWRPPFRGKDYHDTMSQIVSRDPLPLRRWNVRIPKDLETIVLKCLRKDPVDRYGTAEALSQDLRRFERGDPIEARPQSPWERLVRRAWRHKGWVTAAVCLLCLCFTSGWLVLKHRRERLAETEQLYEALVRGAVMNLELGRPALKARIAAPRRREPKSRWLFLAFHNVASAAGRDAALDAWPDPVEEAVDDLKTAVSLFPSRPDAHYHLGRGLWLLKRRDEALESLSTALECQPGFVPAAMFREVVLEKEEGGEETPAKGRSAERAQGDDWGAAWLGAHLAVRREDWKQAAAAYTRLIEKRAGGERVYSGSSVEARMGRGRALLADEDLDGALEDFSAAHALWPDRLEPVLLLAKTHYLKNKPARAEEKLERFHSRAKFPDDVALKAASLYRECEAYERGLRWANRMPKNLPRERMRADLLSSLGRLDEAAQAAREVVRLDGGNARAHNYLAVLLEDLGRPDEALGAYERALELDPDLAVTYYNLGGLRAAQGNPEEAIRNYRKAIERDPQRAAAHNNLGLVLAAQGKLAEAEAAIRRAIALDEALPHPHNNLGIVLKEQGKLEDATVEYRTALSLDPEFAGAYDNLGQALRMLRRLDDAIENHRRAIELNPDAAKAHSNLGLALQDKGRLDEAIERFERALELDPALGGVHGNLGNALAKKGKHERAIVHLSKAAELDPSRPQPHIGLGSLYAKQGKLDEAIESYLRGAELCAKRLEENPASAGSRRRLFLTLRLLAQLTTRAGRLEEARGHGRRALAMSKEKAVGAGATVKDLHEYAWMLLTVEPPELRDPARGLTFAEQVVDRTAGEDPLTLDTLALAHFETGDADRAVEVQEKALALLPESSPHRGQLAASLAKFRAARKGKNLEKDR